MRCAWLLLLAWTESGAQTTVSYQAALRIEEAAQGALMACISVAGADCDRERGAYWTASDALGREIADEMRGNNAAVEGATAELGQMVDRMRSYAACRRARRWWQVWKHCRWEIAK